MSFQNARIVAINADPGQYHAPTPHVERGDARLIVSSSMLREFGHCPARWKAGYVSPDSKAKDYGSLLDCRALTPSQFEKRYMVQPLTYKATILQCPKCGSETTSAKCMKCKCERELVTIDKEWTNQAQACKDWNDAQKEAGKQVVSPKQVEDCDMALVRMMEDEAIKAYHECSDKQVWLAAEWNDERTGLVIPVKCLLDYVPRLGTEFAGTLGDLKSARTAAVQPWSRDCFKRGYHIQGSLYRDIYVAATGEDRNTWCFIIQENYPPYQTGKRILSQDFMALGRQQYESLLSRYCQCLKTGHFPGYDDNQNSIQGWGVIEMESYMQFDALSQSMEENQSILLGDAMPEDCDVAP
jgi:exodeoxyribonuclease VIII